MKKVIGEFDRLAVAYIAEAKAAAARAGCEEVNVAPFCMGWMAADVVDLRAQLEDALNELKELRGY